MIGGGGAAAVALPPGGSVYTLAVVAKHNAKSDCWFMVNGWVLNVTKFLSEHPGGRACGLVVCGRGRLRGVQRYPPAGRGPQVRTGRDHRGRGRRFFHPPPELPRGRASLQSWRLRAGTLQRCSTGSLRRSGTPSAHRGDRWCCGRRFVRPGRRRSRRHRGSTGAEVPGFSEG